MDFTSSFEYENSYEDESVDDLDIEEYRVTDIGAKLFNSKHKRSAKAFKEIKEMCGRLHLYDSIVARATCLYDKLLCENETWGINAKLTYLSIICLACRVEDVPRSFREIAAIGDVSHFKLAAVYKKLPSTLKVNVNTPKAIDFVERMLSMLGVHKKCLTDARKIAKAAQMKAEISSCSPVSIAAAAIYLSTKMHDEKLTYKKIRDVTGISSATITRIVKMDCASVENECRQIFEL
ncbi:transcription initiation factor IIB-like [Teleopsis dalmanni]|uniref:transcription initiation factor IIB-like n=1 Tax=Teleopsis dalmanni TaxID=139649 RepID=UPI0018CF6637|nr:transcription initiation factor IIB-like [Teleopsis dalmanni]